MPRVVSDSVVVEVDLVVRDDAGLEEDDPLQVHDGEESPEEVYI